MQKVKLGSILNAVFLIAGTTVGGGFLALPTVVAPNGFVPSAVALVGVWAFFWLESLVVVECIVRAHGMSQEKEGEQNGSHPGIAAAAKSAFGSWGESIVVLLLVLLTQATLVSQISRAGTLLLPATGGSYRLGCAITALSVATVVFGFQKFATTINSCLTLLFVTMAVVLFGTGAPAADWSRLAVGADWTSLPQAIPTFLQLLVFGEILPTVCQLLKYRTRPIRLAITIGSFLPLGLEVGWAALGIGLISPGTATAMGDPVDALLAAGPVRLPLFTLAVTAILTTIIGSFLALQSTFDDIVPKETNPLLLQNNKEPKKSRRRLAGAIFIVMPALSIASISPDLFLKAIDFAGSYPVLLLWGLGPPAIAWKQRLKKSKTNSSYSSAQKSERQLTTMLPKWVLIALGGISLILFGMSAAPDIAFLWKTLTS